MDSSGRVGRRISAMQLVFIGLVVLVLLIFLTNTKRWKAIGQGVRKSKRDLTEEIHSLEEDR